MVIVDTSVFVEALRGNRVFALETIIVAGLAAISATVYLELLHGVRSAKELSLKKFLRTIGIPLPWPSQETCLNIIKKSRSKGIRVGIPDILIVADAVQNSASIITLDKELARLAQAVSVAVVPVE